MPVNFQQARDQIREMGSQALPRQERLQQLHAEASEIFKQYAGELDSLELLVLQAAAENPGLRCAAPFGETLDQSFAEPVLGERYTLLAADGSQINPNPHGMVEFGAINVGAIRMKPGEAAQEIVQSKLLFNDDLFTASGGPLTEDIVALKRDLAERQLLAELARSEHAPVAALTDGPLELFREPKKMPEFDAELERYKGVLEDLAKLGVATAGYVDRPRGDLVVRLLELVILQRRNQLNRAGEDRPLRGVYDRHLIFPLLNPGDRSAIYSIRSGSAKSFQGELAVHFFYLNVGREGRSYLSRVEIPRWVAENKVLVDLLHASLLAQSRHLGARPYPYILHRAHEIAVISFAEREQLENMIINVLRSQGIDVDDVSNKLGAKNASSNHTRVSKSRPR